MTGSLSPGWALATLFVFLPLPVAAQADPAAETEGFTFGNTSELTLVWTGGNAASSTLGLKNALTGTGNGGSFKIEAGAIRTQSTARSLTAVGSVDVFEISEISTSDVTAESYFGRARYDRDVSEAAFLFGGGGWERNTFAGIRNRYSAVAGAGNVWADGDDSKFKTDYGLTYTVQDDVAAGPSGSNSFFGLRASWDGARTLTPTTSLTSMVILDGNLEETSDFRVDATHAISVSMTEGLALKASLQLLYDNEPSLLAVPLQAGLGGSPTGEVLTSLDSVDSLFTLALVVNF